MSTRTPSLTLSLPPSFVGCTLDIFPQKPFPISPPSSPHSPSLPPFHLFFSGFPSEWLSETFGYLTLGNGFVAVLAGLVANFFAERYGYIGTSLFPFLLPLFTPSLLHFLFLMQRACIFTV